MAYSSLEECLLDLEQHGQLMRIKEEVDPHLEMAAIHLRVHSAGGPAILFEKVKGSKFRAVSNIFGTLERSQFIFRNTLPAVQKLIAIQLDPREALKNPLKHLSHIKAAWNAIPKKQNVQKVVEFEEIQISDLPLIKHWDQDGGAFVTLPQVYSEDIEKPGIAHSNLGMYRIQLNGNDYLLNKEIGLHYQLHRGIGVHQTKSNQKGVPLKISCFVGGPPAHSVAAVMPLPEGMSELNFAGVLAGKRFAYTYKDGYCLSTDADFIITGEVFPDDNKPEGPFGDHLGYYSLKHPFPVMKVHKVYAKKNAIWAFTVVGRPPQEDTSFGHLIHAITGTAISKEIPGLKEVHAVDAAGVHPLLLAIGSERYTPYLKEKRPAEILTIANHILGTGQLSLAKFVWITAQDSILNKEEPISTQHVASFFKYIMERMDLTRDLHFYTQTSIDTLDYSGEEINKGSKLVLAAYGDSLRNLCTKIPALIDANLSGAKLVMPGVIALSVIDYSIATIQEKLKGMGNELLNKEGLFMLILTEDPNWMAMDIQNFIWAGFTRVNPANDIEGVDAFIKNKHWGCHGPLLFDASLKKHHAPILDKVPAVETRVDAILANYC